MAVVALEEAKQYLRVDSNDEDTFITGLIETGEQMCADMARMEIAELEEHLSMTRIAVLYAIGYLYEHREEADHGKAIAYVTLEFNDEEILIHHPVETWESGKHILSLYYPIDNLIPNITNTFNVYLRIEGGAGTIETGECIASISGQAMAAAAAWDGKITIEEKALPFIIGGGLNVENYSETIKMETMELVIRSYSDHVSGRAAIGAFCQPVEIE